MSKLSKPLKFSLYFLLLLIAVLIVVYNSLSFIIENSLPGIVVRLGFGKFALSVRRVSSSGIDLDSLRKVDYQGKQFVIPFELKFSIPIKPTGMSIHKSDFRTSSLLLMLGVAFVTPSMIEQNAPSGLALISCGSKREVHTLMRDAQSGTVNKLWAARDIWAC